MIRNNWLNNLRARFATALAPQPKLRQKSKVVSNVPAVVETLEPRKLMSVDPVALMMAAYGAGSGASSGSGATANPSLATATAVSGAGSTVTPNTSTSSSPEAPGSSPS